MTQDRQATLEQVAREYLEWLRGTKPSNTYVTQIAVDQLVALLAAQRKAALEEVAKDYERRRNGYRRNGYMAMLDGCVQMESERLRLGAKEELLDVLIQELRQEAQERRP